MGIEPTFSAWEADVLPLNYTRPIFLSPIWLTSSLPQLWEILELAHSFCIVFRYCHSFKTLFFGRFFNFGVNLIRSGWGACISLGYTQYNNQKTN